MIRHTILETSLGLITLVASGDAITGLYFRRHIRRPADDTFGPRMDSGDDVLLDEAARQLTDYLAGDRRVFDLPVDAVGDDFQRSVWTIACAIARGRTRTYGDIATELGNGHYAQEVGKALGANPICIVIPCHRVVAADGSLTGYAGGLKRKRALLELEAPAPESVGRLF
ncbi:methylated-DNA--[protein]-cysteine S-methyltransferase [Jongsikchunia kroppenstedtii]|uniref:methylated-DNA--[protein]-cysteine S-methyltransferase n=1 Tax=Jongsikchunia kroppenstedtii TaxID=1121721 RepID=UPI000376CA65|nr:methylated-DNA--[protein]-cysteine S-methyltransferase [Jongsikchunia kroppenstedtii]